MEKVVDMFGYHTCLCAECKKTFDCSVINKYKVREIDGFKRFCSYKCYNAYLKKKEEIWYNRHKADFEDTPEKKKEISLYTAYRYARRRQRIGLDLGM